MLSVRFGDGRGRAAKRVRREHLPWPESSRGLAVIKSVLADQKVDAVLTREIGEIAFHTLRDHYVTVYCAPACTVAEALAQFAKGSLPPLTVPTHASEAAAAPTHPARTEQEDRQ